MTAQELKYVNWAMAKLAEPMELKDRIKVNRIVSQILAREADALEDRLIDLEAMEV